MNTLLGRIGSPETPADPTGLLQIYTAYPNPFNGSTRIRFVLSRAAEVQAWIVRGVGFSEQEYPSKLAQVGEHLVARPGGLAVLETAQLDYPVGMHTIVLDMHALPDGFYRYYVQADEVLLWTDLLLLTDLSCFNLRRLGLSFLSDHCS